MPSPEKNNSSITDRIKTVFRSLSYRNYRLFFMGQNLSLIGTWMQRIALPWLVYHMTGSAFLLGVVSFAGQIPTFILAPVAGVITDKFNKHKVLLVTQSASLIQASILAFLTLTGHIQIWHIVVLGILLGSINAFDIPTRQSFVIEMVEKKEHLGNAIALNSMMFNSARLIGPTIAGLMLSFTGEGMCFLLNAVSYLFVIGSLLRMKLKAVTKISEHVNVFKELKKGFNYTFGFSPIKYLIVLLAVVSLMGASFQLLMPVFAKEILHGSSSTFGFLMGGAGMGALIGALFLASRETVIRLGRLIPAAAGLFGTGLILLSFTKYLPVSLVLVVIAGLGLMLHTASSNTILQTITDDDKRGRVMSFYTMAIMGTAPFGSLMAGSLAKIIGTPATMFAGGLSCLLGSFLFYRKLPELKNIIRPVYIRMGLIPEVISGIQTASEPVVKHSGLQEIEPPADPKPAE
jgi:MFS family permease